jgi:hypothetical protein
MSTLKINKNVAIPSLGEMSRTIKKMKVGDSFEVPNRRNTANIYAAARRVSRKVTVHVKEGDETMLVVWRVANDE